jgi:hypothetical protein
MVGYFLNIFQIFISRGRASTNGCKSLETRSCSFDSKWIHNVNVPDISQSHIRKKCKHKEEKEIEKNSVCVFENILHNQISNILNQNEN